MRFVAERLVWELIPVLFSTLRAFPVLHILENGVEHLDTLARQKA